MSPKDNFRDKQKQIREDAILDGAQKLLSDSDFFAVTMDDVAAEVGISKATLYQHFASKEDLVAHMIARCMSNAENSIRALPSSVPPIDRLKEAFRIILNARFGRPLGEKASYIPIVPIIKSHPIAQAQQKRMVAVLAELVDAAKQDHKIGSNIPTRILVQVFLSQLRSGEYEEWLKQGVISIDALSAIIIGIIIDGVGTMIPMSQPAKKVSHG